MEFVAAYPGRVDDCMDLGAAGAGVAAGMPCCVGGVVGVEGIRTLLSLRVLLQLCNCPILIFGELLQAR